MARLGFELGQEHSLEQKVAQFFAKRFVIVAIDRLEHFVGLLEHERLQRVDRLLAVPGTAFRRAQRGHDLDEAEEFIRGGHWHLVIW